MDRGQFDSLARVVSAKQSRRAALAALLGAALLGQEPVGIEAKAKKKVKAQAKAQKTAKPCYPGTRCTAGNGKNASGCDFTASTAFFRKDFRGANLSNSNFTGAQLAESDFRGANLSGACFVNANLRHARLGSSVNLTGALFCRTIMPDGSLNDRDCGKATACCPMPTICSGPECGPDDCVPHDNICTLLWFGNPCCSDQVCTPGIIPVVTTCQLPCSTQQQCLDLDPRGFLVCAGDAEACPFIGNCCTEKSCESDADCPPPTKCGGAICQFDVSN